MSGRKRSSSPSLGFSAARRRAISALSGAEIAEHEARDVLNEKNLLATGDVSPGFVVMLLKRCTGAEYSSTPHHFDRATLVHIFRPWLSSARGREQWYIKLYFRKSTVFISVHRSRRDKGTWRQ